MPFILYEIPLTPFLSGSTLIDDKSNPKRKTDEKIL